MIQAVFVFEGSILTAVAMSSSGQVGRLLYAILLAYAQGSYMYSTHIVDYQILTYANALHTSYVARYERISTERSILSTDSSREGSKSTFVFWSASVRCKRYYVQPKLWLHMRLSIPLQNAMHVDTGS